MGDGDRTVIEVRIPSNPDYLARLRRIVGCLAGSVGMGTREVQDAKLAISEACANAIRHGSPRGEADRVTVRFSSAAGTVVAEVTDSGAGFDPDDVPPRRAEQPGGFGLSLMKTLTDEVQFVKNGTGMTVRLVKRAKRLGSRLRSGRG